MFVVDGGGQLLLCPFCVDSRGLKDAEFVANARIGGASPLLAFFARIFSAIVIPIVSAFKPVLLSILNRKGAKTQRIQSEKFPLRLCAFA